MLKIRSFAAILIVFVLMAALMTIGMAADEAENTEHHLAFCSDVCGRMDILTNVLKGFPEDLEYVSLIGNTAEDKDGEAAAYNTSSVFGPVMEMFENIMSHNFSIIWTDRDANAIDDADVVWCRDGDTSEELCEGRNGDGSSAYYIYGIGINHMTGGGPASMDAAEIFKHWVKGKDETVPVIVVCPVPIEAKCGNNLGASYWNEALNFAATGVEGITGEDDSYAIIRNVIFLYGQNRSSDSAEYVYQAGSTMPVQVDTTITSGPFSLTGLKEQGREIIAAETEEEDTVLSDGNTEAALGAISSIYYTVIAPGYIKTNGNTTLMDITEDAITFTKFNGESQVSLGTDGETGEAFGNSLRIRQFHRSDVGGPAIKSQPENTVVSYPEGALFAVEAEDPDEIASYQWYMLDKENSLFPLEGSSAHTDTLTVPSTLRMNDVLRFYCVLTGRDGLKTVSRYASLDLDNREISKPVFYVGEYAIEPGESIDLAAVDIGDGRSLGSGTVTFDGNGKDLTIENLSYDNSYTKCGLATAPGIGLDMEFYQPDQEEYTVTFIGDSEIVNTYYNYEYNLGGIPLDFYFNGDEGEKPLVNFVGDGTLSITNGYNAIRVIGDLMIDVDITVNQNRPYYADGISANNILLAEGSHLDLTVNGYAIRAAGNLFMQDSEVKISASTPRISEGTVTKDLLCAQGAISLNHTNLEILSVSDQSICGRTAGDCIISSEGELFITNGSKVNCDIQTIGEEIFASSFAGIYVWSGYVEDAYVSVRMDAETCTDSIGIFAEKNFQVTNSELNVETRSSGTAYGIAVERDFNAENSNVDVRVSSCTDSESSCSLICENAVFKIDDREHKVKLFAEDGLALECDLGEELADSPAVYEAGYETEHVYLRDNTVCMMPADNAVSLGSVAVPGNISRKYLLIETYYDLSNTLVPAAELVFGLDPEADAVPFDDIDAGKWYYDAAVWAGKERIVRGYGEVGIFEPEAVCTRAQAVTFLYRLAGEPEVAAVNPFRDVAEDQYYYDAVAWAAEKDITEGVGETEFDPSGVCTRAQFITFLYRYAGEPETEAECGFRDVPSGKWYTDAVVWAAENGIAMGISKERFAPYEKCTRSQTVVFLYRMAVRDET